MATTDTNAKTDPAMEPVEFLNRVRAIVNRFVAAAHRAQASFEGDLKALFDDPACEALAEAQPHLVKAIADAEMERMGEALPK